MLERLIDATPQLWRGKRPNHGQRTLPSGHTRLDAQLPGRGWPLGAVTELIPSQQGLGEFGLLFPALARLGELGQWIVLVDPPWIPYPASLQGHGLLLERLLLVRSRHAKESLWACEQALRNGSGGAVLAWPPRIDFTRLRRLQLAAESHGKLVFLFRPEQALREPSPAALRLQLETADSGRTRIRVLKCRGGRPSDPVCVAPPFSSFAKPTIHTESHALNGKHEHTPLLDGHSLSTPGPGPLHPGAVRAGSADRRQRPH